jgi:hypothetical protein
VKRGTFDVLRRAVDNTIANWPLIVVRLFEMLILGAIAVVMIIVAIVPIFVSIGIEISRITTPDDFEDAAQALMGKWPLLLWILASISVLILIVIVVHSFIEAGCARVNVDGERNAGAALTGPRSRFDVFSMERWLAGGRQGWWTIFWIYNIAWTVALLILLIPLLPTAMAVLLFQEQQGIMVAFGCIGLVVTTMLMMVVFVYTGMWVNRAVAEWAANGFSARRSLAAGRAAMHSDLGRHLLIFIAVLVVSLAGSSFFSSFSFFAALGDIGSHRGPFNMNFFFFPMRIAGTLLSTVFSALVSSWYLAAYSSLATE